METWLEKNNFRISYCFFTKELKAYCKNLRFDVVESKVKKICKKSPRVWVGIKEKIYIPEQEIEPEEEELIEV